MKKNKSKEVKNCLKNRKYWINKLVILNLVWLLMIGCVSTGIDRKTTPTTKPSALQIYKQIAPSIAFIQTSISSGSGVLIDGGWVLTNAHVVWPESEARLVFPDGTEIMAVPVAYWDLIGDIALLGPISVDFQPIDITGNEDVSIGSDVYMVGYPMESDRFPQPTIVKGILSRVREWEAEGITFFQTDAPASPGQSGGLLIDANGTAIGISGLSFSKQRFGMVASTVDILRRVEAMLKGTDIAKLGKRDLPKQADDFEYDVKCSNCWDFGAFLIDEDEGTKLEIDVRSEVDIRASLVDIVGLVVAYSDDVYIGTESVRVTTQIDAPYFLLIKPTIEGESIAKVTANVELTPITDPDDGRHISVGERIYGNIDYPNDYDFFRLKIPKEKKVGVSVESVMIDSYCKVDPGVGWQTAADDNSGGGVLGLNARLVFKSPFDGDYFIVVADVGGYGIGGYIVDIASADDLSETVTLKHVEAVENKIAGETTNKLSSSETAESVAKWNELFTFKPKGWVEDTEFCKVTMELFGNKMNGNIIIFGGGKPIVGGYLPNLLIISIPVPHGTTLQALVDGVVELFFKKFGFKLRNRKQTTISQRDAELVTIMVDPDSQTVSSQFYVLDNGQLWILQCTGFEGSEEMKIGMSVLTSYKGFERVLEGTELYKKYLQTIKEMDSKLGKLVKEGLCEEAIEQGNSLCDFTVKHFGRGHRFYAISLNRLAKAYKAAGEKLKAEELFLDSIEKYKSLGLTDNLEFVNLLNSLAWMYYENGRYSEGVQFAERGVHIQENLLDQNDIRSLPIRHTLGVNLFGQKRLQEAAQVIEEVVNIYAKDKGDKNEEAVGYMTDYAAVLRQLGLDDKAETLEERIAATGIKPPDWSIKDSGLPAERSESLK